MLEAARALLDTILPGAGRSASAFAPGRVNLIGEHVDYNLGPVLPVPLSVGTGVAVRIDGGRIARFRSRDEAAALEVDLDDPPAPAALGWAAYPVGLALELRRAGVDVPGFSLAAAGNMPVGAGLSSSASLLVATGRALDEALGVGLDPARLAVLAFQAETGFVGVSCGLMDPMASSVGRPGHALFLDCRDRSHELVPYDGDRLGLVVIDSGTRRTLTTSRYNERVAECAAALDVIRVAHPTVRSLRDAHEQGVDLSALDLPDRPRRRAAHVVAEIARVYAFREALFAGDLARCGALVTACHESLRDLYEASTPALDAIVDLSVATEGVLGARLTGAGWGGCLLALVRRGAEDALEAAVEGPYRARFGLEARFHRVG